jgi:predicted nucleotide-binding protein (sugar kinase/HSP70/actin superfamily)
MRWLTDVKNIGQINDEGVPMDKVINMRLSRVCGLATQQRVLLTLERFDDLTKNEMDELFKNSIQAYIEYPEELKQKGKKVAMKIISYAWRTY